MSSLMSWSFVTDFGDSAVTVPIALAIALWLLASDAWRGALAWLSLFGAGALSVFCTKVAYAGWGVGVREIDFTGISGHAFTATSALAVAGYFLGGNCSRNLRILSAARWVFLAEVVVVGVLTHRPGRIILCPKP